MNVQTAEDTRTAWDKIAQATTGPTRRRRCGSETRACAGPGFERACGFSTRPPAAARSPSPPPKVALGCWQPTSHQSPERLRKEMALAGLREITVETITETTQFKSGKAFWDWLMWSNPIVDAVLAGLDLTSAERSRIQGALEDLVRERAGGAGAAELTNPVNIGVGTK